MINASGIDIHIYKVVIVHCAKYFLVRTKFQINFFDSL